MTKTISRSEAFNPKKWIGLPVFEKGDKPVGKVVSVQIENGKVSGLIKLNGGEKFQAFLMNLTDEI